MKSVITTPYSKPPRRIQAMEARSETGDNSSYFPGCRKDTNCNCEICLASINATLDLMPMSIQKSSLTKLSASKNRSPIPYNRSISSTPTTGSSQITETPPLKSTAKSNLFEKKAKREDKKRERRRWGFGLGLRRLVVWLSVIFAIDSGFSWVVSGVLKTELNGEMVRKVGEECWVGSDLNQKLGFLQKHIEKAVNGVKPQNCSSLDSTWELSKDGLLLSSRCILYNTAAEEVSIWGWPLQTAGLLASGFSSRSLTVLSGRVTEWPSGKTGFIIHEAISTWEIRRLQASAVQMDANTWVLEYTRNPLLENTSLSSAAFEFLRLRIFRVVKEMKEQILLLPAIAYEYSLYYEDNNNNQAPT